jgi:type I restriction enzyme S subunit
MGELKPGWKRVKLGEVVRLNKETCKDPEAAGINRVIGLEHLEPGDLRVRSWADVADGTTFSNRVRPGQVLFGKRRAYQRKVAVADFDAICSGDIYVFETADQTQLLQELLPFICQTDSFFDYAIGTSAGSLSPRTNWKSLAEYEFALPPLEEQRRLVEALSAFRKYQEKFNEAIRTSKMLREAVFTSYISGESIIGEEIGKLAKFSSGKLIRVSDLPKYRTEWNQFPVVGGNGIAGFSDQPLAEVPTPCIAIGRVGEYCGAVHFIDEPCWVTDNSLYAKSHTERLRSRYLELCLQNLRLNRHATGGAQPLMTQSIINSFKIPVPDLEQQDKIISADMAIKGNIDVMLKRLALVREVGRRLLAESFE